MILTLRQINEVYNYYQSLGTTLGQIICKDINRDWIDNMLASGVYIANVPDQDIIVMRRGTEEFIDFLEKNRTK